jgi:hypothetical protein
MPDPDIQAVSDSGQEYECPNGWLADPESHAIIDLHEVLRRLDKLEREFGPLARRYAKLADTPAARFTRGKRSGG